jgi:MFS family permease
VPLGSIFARQAGLVRTAQSFRLLFLSTLVSSLGTWMAVVALTLDVQSRTHSGSWVSALLIADFLPAVAIGLLLGPLVDRLWRKWLLVVADVARVGVFVALPFTTHAREIVALAFVAGVATGFARPATYAGLPNLVAEDDLAQANSVLRFTEYVTTMIGTALGGAIVAASGPDLAYWLNAATFALSAVLLVRIPAALLQVGAVPSRGHLRDIADGFAVIRRSTPLIAVLVSWNFVMLSNAGINVSEVFLAKDSLDGGSFGFGLMWAASGVGLAIGSFFASTWLDRRSMTAVYTGALLLMAFGAGAAAASPNVWVAVWCMVLGGTGNGTAIVCNSLLVQRGAPDHLRGRVFTLIMGSNFAVLGVGMVAAGPLTDALGGRWIFGGAAICAAAGAVPAYLLLRRMRGSAPAAAAAA